ncbi:MAG: hypothetical protein ACREPY_05735 [Rhodanobacteraceae bacterium]
MTPTADPASSLRSFSGIFLYAQKAIVRKERERRKEKFSFFASFVSFADCFCLCGHILIEDMMDSGLFPAPLPHVLALPAKNAKDAKRNFLFLRPSRSSRTAFASAFGKRV